MCRSGRVWSNDSSGQAGRLRSRRLLSLFGFEDEDELDRALGDAALIGLVVRDRRQRHRPSMIARPDRGHHQATSGERATATGSRRYSFGYGLMMMGSLQAKRTPIPTGGRTCRRSTSAAGASSRPRASPRCATRLRDVIGVDFRARLPPPGASAAAAAEGAPQVVHPELRDPARDVRPLTRRHGLICDLRQRSFNLPGPDLILRASPGFSSSHKPVGRGKPARDEVAAVGARR